MDTNITQEQVNQLKGILINIGIKGEDGYMTYKTVFATTTTKEAVDRLQTHDMIKDKYTRETLQDFLDHFARLLEMELGTYSIEDFDRIFQNIYEGENNYGEGLDDLAGWFVADPFGREDYINDALEYLVSMDDRAEDDIPPIQDILQEAKLRETLAVFDVGYSFIKWLFGVDEE